MPKPTPRKFLPAGPPPRFRSPHTAHKVLREYAQPAPPHLKEVVATAAEFTACCPMTGQPDTGTVRITYTPRDKILESKALKTYLWSFRNFGAMAEDIANLIAIHVLESLGARRVEVLVVQAPRGGIGIEARAALEGTP